MKKRYWIGGIISIFLFACSSTKKVTTPTPIYSNALIHETSPYLLQHAHNPVNWVAWNNETLQKALSEQKLLLISIGYAACHWCHVMEKESFSDTAVANVMNRYFINIKIDREERPDIDNLYTTACQLTSGNACGWPLNVIALPDGRPIWTGTYRPKADWVQTLNFFIKAKQNELPQLEAYAQQLKQGIQQIGTLKQPENTSNFDKNDIPFIIENIVKGIDTINGGQKGKLKFPMPALFDFGLEMSEFGKLSKSCMLTLDNMARGGIYDQLGGGFARYTTDSLWQIPHFEKMLYDNGQLVSLYSHAFQATRKPLYEKVVRQTLSFVEQNWMNPNGAFYSAFDADAEEGEGAFYTWKKIEIDKILGKNAPIFNAFFDISADGNWEDGKNILYNKQSISTLAKQHNTTEKEIETIIETSKNILFKERNKRHAPKLDNKILTAWNALMLKGYIDAYKALGDKQYLDIALKNGHFIAQNLVQKEGKLYRNYAKNKPPINGFLEDYAFTMQAFLALYEVTFDEKWVLLAQKMADYVLTNFEDSATGMFLFSAKNETPLAAQTIIFSDDAIPNANATFALALQHLGALLEKKTYSEKAISMMQNMYETAISEGQSIFYFTWCKLFKRIVEPPFEVAIVGQDAAKLSAELMKNYLPNALFLGGTTEGKLPLLEGKLQKEGTYIYVCQNKSCKKPVKTVAEALVLLKY